MAHATEINALAEKLVDRILDRPKRHSIFKQAKQRALRGLRDQKHPRTNQFQVQSQLVGLVEKFSVRNRDDLADALQTRVDELPKDSNWVPEALALILSLSGQPLEKSLATDFGLPFDERGEQEVPLTWKQILEDDPWTAEDAWTARDVDYHSSGDEHDDAQVDDQVLVSTIATTVDDREDFTAVANQFLLEPDPTKLEPIVAAQAQLSELDTNAEVKVLTEALLVQETLSMLQGHPNHVFVRNSAHTVRRIQPVRLCGASHTTVDALLDQLASLGSRLNILRTWNSTKSDSPSLQSMQRFISHEFSRFSEVLCLISTRMCTPKTSNTVSVISLCHSVQEAARTLLHCATVIENASTLGQNTDFLITDLLYDEACLAQTSANFETFLSLSECFLISLNLYLDQIYAPTSNDTSRATSWTSILVEVTQQDPTNNATGPPTLVMRTRPDGNPFAPKCLYHFADRIFAQIRSDAIRAFVQQDEASATPCSNRKPPILMVGDCIAQIREEPLRPFSKVLDGRIRFWLDERDQVSVDSIGQLLWRTCRAGRAVSHLPTLFFARDGAAFTDFASVLFERLESAENAVNGFLLSELAQATIGASCFDLAQDRFIITVAVPATGEGQSCPHTVLQRLGDVSLIYGVPWPVRFVTNGGQFLVPNKVLSSILRLSWAQRNLTFCWALMRQFSKAPDRRESLSQQLLKLRRDLGWFIDVWHTHVTTWAAIHHGQVMKEMGEAAEIGQISTVWSAFEDKLEIDLLLRQNMSTLDHALVEVFNLSRLLKESLLRILSPGIEVIVRCRHDSVKSRSFTDLSDTFAKLHAFITAGVRSAARATGSAALDGLADALNTR